MIKLPQLPGNCNPAVRLPVNHFIGRGTLRGEKITRNAKIVKLNIGVCVRVCILVLSCNVIIELLLNSDEKSKQFHHYVDGSGTFYCSVYCIGISGSVFGFQLVSPHVLATYCESSLFFILVTDNYSMTSTVHL